MDRALSRGIFLLSLTTALFFVLWWRGHPPKVDFDVRYAGGRVEVGELYTYGSFDPPAQPLLRMESLPSRPWAGAGALFPGQYLVSLFGPEPSGAPGARLPLLLLKGQRVTWDLPAAPPTGMIFLPPGPFLLGPDGGVAETNSLLFAMRAEVDIGLFRRFLAAAAQRAPGAFRSAEEQGRFGENALPLVDALTFEDLDERLPVHRIHFFEAMAFARWYTETYGEGRIEYRLPTRLEWVKLALGTDGRVHPWGNQVLLPVHRATDTRGLVPVDSFPDRASPYGALHMEGNVAEWTLEDVRGDGTRRLVLGRSLDADSDLWRAAVGLGEDVLLRSPDVGFRLVGVPR